METTYIAVTAFMGAVVSATLGWLDSTEPFNPKKFGKSVIHAVVAGITFAIGYNYVPPLNTLTLFIVFLGGAGVDVGLNRAEGAIRNKLL